MTTATFEYAVRDRSGKVVTGRMDADSESAVAGKLRGMGYAPITISEANAGLKRELAMPKFGKRVKLKDLAIFARQFATMINSGLSLLRALSILEEQTDNDELGRVISEVRLDVEQGTALSSAMSRHPEAFPPLMVNMTRAGEVGGFGSCSGSSGGGRASGRGSSRGRGATDVAVAAAAAVKEVVVVPHEHLGQRRGARRRVACRRHRSRTCRRTRLPCSAASSAADDQPRKQRRHQRRPCLGRAHRPCGHERRQESRGVGQCPPPRGGKPLEDEQSDILPRRPPGDGCCHEQLVPECPRQQGAPAGEAGGEGEGRRGECARWRRWRV